MSAFLDRLRASRESWVSVGAYEFQVRRPTDVELVKARGDDDSAFVRRVVIGWRGVRECDVIPSGGGEPAPFDAEACVEWLEDQPALYVELVNRVQDLIRARFEARDDAAKK